MQKSGVHGISGSLARVACVEERMEWQNVNLNTNFESKPLAGLGRGRLSRAHACGRASTSGCGGDGSMVTKAKAMPMSKCLTQMRHGRSICRKLSRTDA